MRAARYGRHGRTARTAGAQDRRRRHQHCRITPPHAAAFRCSEISHTQLDLFTPPTSVDPLLGLAVTLPNTCSNCAALVAIIGPGKPPHSASLLCRSCGLHRGWVSRANCISSTRLSTSCAHRVNPLSFVLAVRTRSKTTTELVSFNVA
jgi:hypothetical protein